MLSKHCFSKEIKRQIKELYKYDNYHCFIALALNLTWIGVAVYIAEINSLLLPLSIILIGSRQRALATPLHEASHAILCRNKRLEKIIGTYCSGYLVFQTWSSYKRSHTLDHHHKLGDPDRDPDYKYYRNSGIFNKNSKSQFIFFYLVKPLLFLNALSSLRYLVANRFAYSSDKSEFLSLLLCQIIIAATLTAVAGLKGYILYWLIPYLTIFQTLTWFIELAEHCPMIARAKTDLEATRNRFGHPVEHFFTAMHGKNFHLTHHLFPALPYWNLKKAHQVLLTDPAYAALNANFGGVFLSSNFAPSMWCKLLQDKTPIAERVINED